MKNPSPPNVCCNRKHCLLPLICKQLAQEANLINREACLLESRGIFHTAGLLLCITSIAIDLLSSASVFSCTLRRMYAAYQQVPESSSRNSIVQLFSMRQKRSSPITINPFYSGAEGCCSVCFSADLLLLLRNHPVWLLAELPYVRIPFPPPYLPVPAARECALFGVATAIRTTAACALILSVCSQSAGTG